MAAGAARSFRRPPPLAWGRAPLLPPLAAAVGGIVLAHTFGYAYGAYWFGGAGAALAAAGVLHFLRGPGRSVGRAASLLLLVSVGLGFAAYAALSYPPNRTDYFGHFGGEQTLTARVLSSTAGARRLRVELDVAAATDSTGGWRTRSGRTVAFLPPDERAAALRPGDTLLLRGRPTAVAGPLNPEAIDFRSYWAGRGVYHQLRLSDGAAFVALGRGRGSRVIGWAARGEAIREQWLRSMRPFLHNDQLAVAAALVLGKRDLLSADVRSAYADTGAVHVLAVSGLHVGIVAGLVLYLMGWRRARSPLRRAATAAVAVGAVWGFALVTGLSPSVQRAALMFSILIAGTLARRSAGSFNLLGAAALVMLLITPSQLFRVGFQLSFLAVAGILVFAPPFLRVAAGAGRWLRSLWSALSVSTGAQLGTLPLSLHYFRQFPVYFLLSGTLVIVTAYLILSLGLLHGLLAGVLRSRALAALSGAALGWAVDVQNAIVFYCRKLPLAAVPVPGVGPVVVALTYLLLALAAVWLYWRRQVVATVALLLLLVAGGGLAYATLTAPPLRRAVIYHLPRGSLLDVFSGVQLFSVGSSPGADVTERAAGPLRARLGHPAPPATPLTATATDTLLPPGVRLSYPLLEVFGRRVLLLDGNRPLAPLTTPPEVDLVWVTNGYRPRDFSGAIPPGALVVVLDGSSPRYRVVAWRERAAAEGWVIHHTGTDGAFELLQ